MLHDKIRIREALQSSETLATIIHAIVLNQYGEQVYMWEPLTVELELSADFSADISPVVMDRWSAVQIVMSTNAFFKQLDAFLGICNTLTSGEPFFAIFDPVSVEESCWAITEVSLNREIIPFSYPILQYLDMVLKQDGYVPGTYPEILKEAMSGTPETLKIRQKLGSPDNRDMVEGFIDEQLKDLAYQFDNIKDLKDLDNIILQRSMDEYVGDVVKEGDENE